MPHRPDDQRYPHLPLVAEQPNPDRRKKPPVAPPPAPDRGGRSRFAAEMRDRIDRLEQDAVHRPKPTAGIQPHLVFRVPLAGKISPQVTAELLERLGVTVVAIESDRAIIAFRDQVDLSEFRQAVAAYEQGPRVNPQTGELYASTQWDGLEYIEAQQMRLWGRHDRIGRRLAQEIGDEAQSIAQEKTYVLDVELWHRGTADLARAGLAELRLHVEHQKTDGEKLSDSFIGHSLCLARIAIRGAKLDALLNLDVVAEADIPPQPVFDHRAAAQATPQDFGQPPYPQPGGPHVCMLDSGIATNHPLLARNVGHAEAILAASETAADEHGHGTMVGGLAVFGDIRACFETGLFQSPVTLFSARVLNAQNQFDSESLIIHQMRRAVEVFSASPYNCRVFNVSLGDNVPWLGSHHRQSIWAESLDILSREMKVLFVVSAGNHNLGWALGTDDAEEILTSYPDFLFDRECGLCEPATAAIPITVGGVAEHQSPAIRPSRRADDLVRVVAEAGQPTPTTRIGPGLNGAIKPEIVAPAGNVAFEGFSEIRRVEEDPGLAVMSLSHQPTESLFAYGLGTSYAAPRVARSAAILWDNLQQMLGEEPQANLVRAVLAAGSSVPNTLHELIHPEHGEEGVRRVCGYGGVDDELAFESADRRVTLITQGTLPLDTFAIYEVPAPDEFRKASGTKRVIVTLAFDPPVRRRRAEYLGVRMYYSLFRGKTLDEIVEAYKAISAEERVAARRGTHEISKALQAPFRLSLKPGPQTLQGSTLQRSEVTFQSERNDYGDTWYLVVRTQRTWAPATFTGQDFAATVTLLADEPRLYNLVRNRIQLRQQQRARARL